MKKTTLKSAATALASLILIGSIQAKAVSADSKIIVDGRADYLSQNYNDDGTSRPSNGTFRINAFRMDMQGKLGEETSYRFRMNFPNSPATTTYSAPADNISSFFDYAYVARTLAEGLTLTVGKQWGGTGGWVGTYDPADVYVYPAGFIDLNLNTVVYVTGAGLKYMTGLGSFSLVASDPGVSSTDNGTSTGNSNNGRTALSGRWFGKFMDGALQPTLSYMTEGRQNQSSSTKNLVNTYTSGGIRFTKPVFDIDADYFMNSFADKTTAGQSDATNSMFILARYKMVDLGLKAFATYENSTRKTETSATVEKKVDTSAITLGVEYYPKKDEDFRYHLAYTNQTIKTDLGTGAAATNQAMQQIIAGVRFKSDLLK